MQELKKYRQKKISTLGSWYTEMLLNETVIRSHLLPVMYNLQKWFAL